MRRLETNISLPIFSFHVHGKAIAGVIDREVGTMLNPGEQSAPKESDEALVCLPPPDEDTVLHTLAGGIADRNPVSHIR